MSPAEPPEFDETDPGGAADLPPAPAGGAGVVLPRRAREADLWDALARWRAERRRFVVATVVGTRGFTPRKAGARMLVAEDGTTAGTIGGGAIEHEVLREARALFERGGTARVDRHLTQELGMCCGGEMSVFLEVVDVAPRVWVFGAGYIAGPLAAIATGCGFEVTVVDGRAEWATAERFPTSRVVVQDPADFARAFESAPGDCVVITTHDHALDQRLVQALLPRPLRFLGMLGSQAKQRKFALRLRARGFSDADIARLHSPVGLSIGADTPEEIAVSVVAQLIAVRRGRAVEPGWVPPARAGSPAPAEADEAPAPEGGTGGQESEPTRR
jgi:xanthine dehydrogenase accessory factor